MLWKKHGLLFEINGINPKLLTHASNPLPLKLSASLYRVFFSSRDANNRSSVGYADIDMDTYQLIDLSKEPILEHGNDNSFFSHGISIGNNYEFNGKDYILFMGWNIPQGEHWRGDIGQLELINKKKIIVKSAKPFMGIDKEDPISLSYPFVINHDGMLKMWYGSTVTWKEINGEMVHVIKYATSKDGINWKKNGLAIPFELGVAQAFSRPTVIIENGRYHMWYSYRSGDGTKYKIGYANSSDGIKWIREHEKFGLSTSEIGWDSEMVCYPFVFKHNGIYMMLYNGNNYGKSGVGLATIEKL